MVAAASLARVTRVLVLWCDRFDEADRIERAGIRRGVRKLDKLLFVTQVRPPFGAGREGPVIVERVVVELELAMRTVRIGGVRARIRIRAVRTIAIRPTRRADIASRVRPPARVPRPTDARRAELVADR